MTTTLAPEIAEFAAAVRAQLVDLPPDEIDDLTDGLEADLAERQADGPDEPLGDPATYAAELRAAAGYPARPPGVHAGKFTGFPALRSLLAGLRARGADVGGVLVSLAPAWWVLRGVVVGSLLSSWLTGDFPFPTSIAGWALVLASTLVSVQFGRNRWLPFRWMKVALKFLNVIIVVALPFLWASAAGTLADWRWAYSYAQEQSAYVGDTGLFRNGVEVGNIFAYDADGNPIEVVQLFDQNGEPLNIVADPSLPWASGDQEMIAPSEDVVGRLGWNVYPLDTFHDSDAIVNDDGTTDPNTKPAQWPFVTVKPLADDSADEAR